MDSHPTEPHAAAGVPPELLDQSIVSEVRDAYAMFGAMRRQQPVMLVQHHQPVYLVPRYDDVATVLRDNETFSSSVMHEAMGSVMGRTILEVAGREHTVHRGRVSHAFRPKPAMIGPANRDESHYPDPERFDMHRHADDHLSFGLGEHFCLGCHLARVEALTAARAALERLRNLRLEPQPESYIRGVTFRSPNCLPVSFDR